MTQEGLGPMKSDTPKTLRTSQSCRLLSLKEAAAYMGWTVWEIRRFIWSGEISYIRRGQRKIFIDRRDLDTWIDDNKERWNEDLL